MNFGLISISDVIIVFLTVKYSSGFIYVKTIALLFMNDYFPVPWYFSIEKLFQTLSLLRASFNHLLHVVPACSVLFEK